MERLIGPDIGSEDPKLLRRRLIYNGLMEYVSIPWENHWEGFTDGHKTWTVNLALWFVHILAGNHYEVRWEYGRLEDENLVALAAVENQSDPEADDAPEFENRDSEQDGEEGEETSLSSDSGESEATMPFYISPRMKRKRDSEEEEYHLSFSKRQVLHV